MKRIFTFALVFAAISLSAQMVTFEEFNLSPETDLDGSDGSGGFSSTEVFLPNTYYDDGTYAYWESGWAISNKTDIVSMTQANATSAITGGGHGPSANYSVGSATFGEAIMNFTDPGYENTVTSLSITNSTLAYQTMVNGGPFGQKVFGGLTGNDPDFFLLTIKGYKNGILTSDSVDFYLADFRFTDNSQDYIVDEWTSIDLSSIEAPDSLAFSLSSSDNNAFGMLTPGYFCIDNIDVSKITATNQVNNNNSFTISPNPANSFFKLGNISNGTSCLIYTINGKLVNNLIVDETELIDISTFTSGTYLVKLIGDKGVGTQLLVIE